MRNVSEKRCRENQNFMVGNFPRETCYLYDNVEKYGTAGQATDNIIKGRKNVRLECCANKPRIQTLTDNWTSLQLNQLNVISHIPIPYFYMLRCTSHHLREEITCSLLKIICFYSSYCMWNTGCVQHTLF
jgi:hypothetical protein